jgi:hypothetical protein
MQLAYRLSLKDFQEANQAHFKSQFWVYWAFWIFLLLGILSLILYFLGGQQLDFFLIVCPFFFPIICFNPYSSNPLKNYIIKLDWKGLHNLHHPMTVEVNEETIKMKNPVFNSSVKWQLYIKAVETKNLFMIYQTKRLFDMIPKRAFSSNEQVEEFRELVRTKIEKFSKV